VLGCGFALVCALSTIPERRNKSVKELTTTMRNTIKHNQKSTKTPKTNEKNKTQTKNQPNPPKLTKKPPTQTPHPTTKTPHTTPPTKHTNNHDTASSDAWWGGSPTA
jgi:outer membrane biosynthesis protein TonB